MAVNGLEHLKTPDKVDFLVEKFDERTQHEWEYFRSKQGGKTYDRFFTFLLDRTGTIHDDQLLLVLPQRNQILLPCLLMEVQ